MSNSSTVFLLKRGRVVRAFPDVERIVGSHTGRVDAQKETALKEPPPEREPAWLLAGEPLAPSADVTSAGDF
jgi:hypothetical protein